MPRQLLPPTYWQTGHLDVIRAVTILQKHSLTGERVFPISVDPECAVDIDTAPDLARAEALLRGGRLDLVIPAAPAARSALADRSAGAAAPENG
jgi:N-acylneuraminate cytidylyltransferase